jgi:hypothetical protein
LRNRARKERHLPESYSKYSDNPDGFFLKNPKFNFATSWDFTKALILAVNRFSENPWLNMGQVQTMTERWQRLVCSSGGDIGGLSNKLNESTSQESLPPSLK